MEMMNNFLLALSGSKYNSIYAAKFNIYDWDIFSLGISLNGYSYSYTKCVHSTDYIICLLHPITSIVHLKPAILNIISSPPNLNPHFNLIPLLNVDSVGFKIMVGLFVLGIVGLVVSFINLTFDILKDLIPAIKRVMDKKEREEYYEYMESQNPYTKEWYSSSYWEESFRSSRGGSGNGSGSGGSNGNGGDGGKDNNGTPPPTKDELLNKAKILRSKIIRIFRIYLYFEYVYRNHSEYIPQILESEALTRLGIPQDDVRRLEPGNTYNLYHGINWFIRSIDPSFNDTEDIHSVSKAIDVAVEEGFPRVPPGTLW